MGERDPRIDAYIAKSADFAQPILEHLREVMHQGCPEIEEAIKWGMPAFLYRGKILGGIAAFKQHCALGFWGTRGLIGNEGKRDEAMGQFGRIASLKDLPSKKVLIGHVKQAMKLSEERAFAVKAWLDYHAFREHYRSPFAKQGAGDAIEKISVASNARQIFMIAAIQIAAFQMKWRRYQLAPRRPYSSENPLSNRRKTASTACGTTANCNNWREAAVQQLRARRPTWCTFQRADHVTALKCRKTTPCKVARGCRRSHGDLTRRATHRYSSIIPKPCECLSPKARA